MKSFLLSLAILLAVAAFVLLDARLVSRAAEEILSEARPLCGEPAKTCAAQMEKVRETYEKKEWIFLFSVNRERVERARADLIAALSFAGSGEDEAFRSAVRVFCADLESIRDLSRFSWRAVL